MIPATKVLLLRGVKLEMLKKSVLFNMGFSPRNPKSSTYMAICDKGIREMRANGELDTILEAYGVED